NSERYSIENNLIPDYGLIDLIKDIKPKDDADNNNKLLKIVFQLTLTMAMLLKQMVLWAMIKIKSLSEIHQNKNGDDELYGTKEY
ncbi:2044_t:CDS:2, partial [Entrophospora sp. SA101]